MIVDKGMNIYGLIFNLDWDKFILDNAIYLMI